MHRQHGQKIDEIKQYTLTNETGDAQATVYHVFPGVEVAYASIHMADFDFGAFEQGVRKNYVSIHYCKEGRIEQEIENEFFYLMPGDCSIVLQDKPYKTFRLPLNHYHGISIGVDLAIIDNPLIVFLNSCGCLPYEALNHICAGTSYTALRSSKVAKRFFEDLYEADEQHRIDYLRVKLPELFFRMKITKMDSHKYRRTLLPRTQVAFVKSVADYISQNIHSKITVKKLTLEFGISDTYLQNAFRSVYGMPVISFIRMQKMQSAAQVLIHTTRSVDEIAEEFGYENESKFSATFKKIMGDPPGIYRKEHSKMKIV